MTDKITLELTLDELKLIDKYVEYGEETKHVFDKIKQAYPQPKMTLVKEGKFEIVSYNDKCYVRMDYSYDALWYRSKNTKDLDGNNLILITDDETRNILEGLWYGQVKKDESTKPMDEVVDREENPPSFLRFELDKTLEDLITRWWCDVFTTHDDWDMETAIDDLVEQIQLWLPKEQSHEETQSTSVIDLVDGYNDALRKIKSKLRNKK